MSSINTFTPEQLHTITSPAAAGVVVYCTDTDEVLLTKRSEKKKALPGFWSVPGGESEVNSFESMEACARREFEEETGHVIPLATKLVCMDRYHSTDRLYFVFVYRTKNKFFIKLNDEHSEAKWFKRTSIPEPISDAITDVISKLA